jgi:hypothetical protein
MERRKFTRESLDDRLYEPYGVREAGGISLGGCQPNRVQANYLNSRPNLYAGLNTAFRGKREHGDKKRQDHVFAFTRAVSHLGNSGTSTSFVTSSISLAIRMSLSIVASRSFDLKFVNVAL